MAEKGAGVMIIKQSIDEIYPPRFFARRYKLNWRAPIVCNAVIDVLKPGNIIDVGCATGDLVAEYVRRAVDAYGLEGASNSEDFLECSPDLVFFCDLRQPIHLSVRFDLATCFEVAEHIEKEFTEQFIENLMSLSDKILMSAAPPFQEGHHHVNCQPQEYWVDLFRVKGYARKREIEDQIKMQWEPWRNKQGIKAYFQNLLYFERLEA
jgi:hypothetical protein